MSCYLYNSRRNTTNVEARTLPLMPISSCLLPSPLTCPALVTDFTLPVTQRVVSSLPLLSFLCLSTSNQSVRPGTDVTSPLKPAMNPQLEFKVSSVMLPYEFLLHVRLNYNYLCISCLLHIILRSLGPKKRPHCSTITLCN